MNIAAIRPVTPLPSALTGCRPVARGGPATQPSSARLAKKPKMLKTLGQPPTSCMLRPPGKRSRPPLALAYLATTAKCTACAAMKAR